MNQPQIGVAALLRQLLDRAEKGELSAVAVAVTSPDLCTASCWSMEAATLAELLGSVDILHFRLLQQAQDGP